MKTFGVNFLLACFLFIHQGCGDPGGRYQDTSVQIDKHASEGIWFSEDSASYGVISVEEGIFKFDRGRITGGYIELNPEQVDTLQYQKGKLTEETELPKRFKFEKVEENQDKSDNTTTHTLVGKFEYEDSISSREVRLPVTMNYQKNQIVITSKPTDQMDKGEPSVGFRIIADVDEEKLVDQSIMQTAQAEKVKLPRKLEIRQDSLLTIKNRIPTKIILRAIQQKRVFMVGDTLRLTVGLVNDDNSPAGAPKSLEVQLINKVKNNAPLETVTFEKGQSVQEVKLVLQDEGILELSAVNPELYSGALFLKITPRYGQLRISKYDYYKIQLAAFQPSGSAYLKVYAQSRSFKANGKDSAEVSIFLFDENDHYPEGVKLNIIPSYGRIYPQQIVVKGDEPGILKLVSKDQEDVQLQIVSNPDIEIINNVKVRFVPPVTYIQCISSPPSIHFLEKSNILVRLLDEDSVALKVKSPWQVSLEISEGGGELTPQSFTIQPDNFESKAIFKPRSFIGIAKVRAVSSNLYTNNNTVTVTWPVLIIIVSVIGGLVGGFISYFHGGDPSKKWKIFVGLFTGMVLYWAFILFDIVDYAPDFLLNAFSVFVISLIGGFLGVGSINFVIRKLGVKNTDTPEVQNSP